MATLRNSINDIYYDASVHHTSFNRNQSFFGNFTFRFMEIPIVGDIVEIPCFIRTQYTSSLTKKDCTLIAPFSNLIDEQSYSTFDTRFKYAITTRYDASMVMQYVDNTTYYVTYGGVMNENFKFIALMSWEFDISDDQHIMPVRPVFRLSYECFEKRDKMQKIICGRCLDAVANSCIRSANRVPEVKVKIIIDDIPFKMKEIQPPSILTTNDELLKLAANHIDSNIYDSGRVF